MSFVLGTSIENDWFHFRSFCFHFIHSSATMGNRRTNNNNKNENNQLEMKTITTVMTTMPQQKKKIKLYRLPDSIEFNECKNIFLRDMWMRNVGTKKKTKNCLRGKRTSTEQSRAEQTRLLKMCGQSICNGHQCRRCCSSCLCCSYAPLKCIPENPNGSLGTHFCLPHGSRKGRPAMPVIVGI